MCRDHAPRESLSWSHLTLFEVGRELRRPRVTCQERDLREYLLEFRKVSWLCDMPKTLQQVRDLLAAATASPSRTLRTCVGLLSLLLSGCPSHITALPAAGGTESTGPKPKSTVTQDECVGEAVTVDSVTVCNLQRPGAFKVVNNSSKPVSFLTSVAIEVQGESGRWRRTPAKTWLIPSHGSARGLPGCVTVQSGEHLRPPSWGGFDCTNPFGPNCNGTFSKSGPLRFVVSSCDRSERFEGPPFEHVEHTVESM